MNDQKKQIVKTITKNYEQYKNICLFEFDKLNSEDTVNLRKKKFAKNVKIMIAKNTLMKIAFNNIGLDIDSYSKGNNMMFFAKDPIAIFDFLKSLPKELKNNLKPIVITDSLVKTDDFTNLQKMKSTNTAFY